MHDTNEIDLVWGVEAISKLIGRTYRQTYYMIQSGHLPMVKQVGERYVANRQKLVEFFTTENAA
ncbi:hypothetical protein [Ferirhizobium litorale]|uniref:Uncharacterized protein n=1 Tax=Ferirhizobium litorale TaxID=2927786 RepID=A0AAE3QEI4_9HYPH|nr:hypothetical protein [Fererhizobium litorale]MDI7921754.1 hypothetical protein [Fererhizobium litorale]